MPNPNGRNFYAPIKHRTKARLVDELLTGSCEVPQYHEFDSCTPKVRAIIQELVDRVRPLQVEARKLEVKLKHLKELSGTRNPHIEKYWKDEDE